MTLPPRPLPRPLRRARFVPLAGALALLAATAAGPRPGHAQEGGAPPAKPAAPAAQAAPTAAAAASADSAAGLSKGERKAIREFHMLDFNGDGKLSRAEVSIVPRLAAAFDDADTNHDGYVTLQEVRAFAVQYRAARERERERAARAQPPASAP